MLVGWPDAAFGPHGQDGRCRLRRTIGFTSSTLTGPVHLPQWASRFTREQVKSPVSGEIFAHSEMRGYMDMLSEFSVGRGHEKIRSYGSIDRESLLSHLRAGRLGAGKFLSRHFRGIMAASETGDLGNVAWTPGTENPADGLTNVESAGGPFLISWELAAIVLGRRSSFGECRLLEI